MKIKYQDHVFKGNARKTIEQANIIIEEYQAQGYSLTLRQLYYQFVSRDLFPNRQREYDRLSVVISNGRRAGLIDWDAIVDHTRYLRTVSTWDSPDDIVRGCAHKFKLDLWQHQHRYVEVWFEKDALLGIFQQASIEQRLPFFSCRGYVSDSECWSAAQRFIKKQDEGKECLILHFGDHDPSGLDMTRDIFDRFELFGADPEVKRLALNMNQVKHYKPPPNPAKQSDSRFAKYAEEFGNESWELDALKPDVLVKMVKDAVGKHIDIGEWEYHKHLEENHRADLTAVSDKWDKVVKFANRKSKKKHK